LPMYMTKTPIKVKISFAVFFFIIPMLVGAQVRIGLGGGGYFGLKDQGINASIQLQKELSNFSALTLQFGFIGKSTNLSQDNLNPDFDYFAGRVSYVVLPVEYQYYLPFKKFRIGVFGGPYLGYGLKASILKKLDDFNFEKIDLDFEEQGIRRFDIGIHLGTGVELELPRSKRMFLRVNYALGLVDLDRGENSTYQEGVGVLMGLMIPIKTGKDSEKK
jgi:hypothetical protein